MTAVAVKRPTSISVTGRKFVPGVDRGVAALLTSASWVLQRLPGEVVEQQRGELIQTLHQARDLTVEVRIGAPAPVVRIRDGAVDRDPGEGVAAEAMKGSRHPRRPCSRSSPRRPLQQVRALRPRIHRSAD